ncbi:hypothetical protein FOZ63_031215, partial [Perkinsus olseni]
YSATHAAGIEYEVGQGAPAAVGAVAASPEESLANADTSVVLSNGQVCAPRLRDTASGSLEPSVQLPSELDALRNCCPGTSAAARSRTRHYKLLELGLLADKCLDSYETPAELLNSIWMYLSRPRLPVGLRLKTHASDAHGVWAFGGCLLPDGGGGGMSLVGRCNSSVVTVSPVDLRLRRVLCDFGYFGPVTSQTLTTSIGVCTDGQGIAFFNSADTIYWTNHQGESGQVPVNLSSGMPLQGRSSARKRRWGCLRYSQGYLFAVDEGSASGGVGDTIFRIHSGTGRCEEVLQTHWRVWSFDVYQSPRSGHLRLIYCCLYQDGGVCVRTLTPGKGPGKARMLPVKCVMECRVFSEGRLACLGGNYGRSISVADLLTGAILCSCDLGIWRGVLSIEVDEWSFGRVYVARSWGSDVEGEKQLKRDLLQLQMDYR